MYNLNYNSKVLFVTFKYPFSFAFFMAGLKLIHVSDIHYSQERKQVYPLDIVVELANKLRAHVLLGGDLEYFDSKPLEKLEKYAFVIPGSHDSKEIYGFKMNYLSKFNVIDLSSGTPVKVDGYTIIPFTGASVVSRGVKYPYLMNEKTLENLVVSLDKCKDSLDKTIILSHEPARGFGDMSYSINQGGGIIPGVAALESLVGSKPKMFETMVKSIKPSPCFGQVPDYLAQIISANPVRLFLSGHIHENNAFESAGKDIITHVPVEVGKEAKHLALTSGPFCEDRLKKFKDVIPFVKEEFKSSDKAWDRKIGLVQLSDSGVSYTLLNV